MDPAGHSRQLSVGTPLYLPRVQFKHTEAPVRATVVDPVVHVVQRIEELVLNMPTAHAAHAVFGWLGFVLSCPGLQLQFSIDVELLAHDAFCGQAVQFVVDVAEYLPDPRIGLRCVRAPMRLSRWRWLF